MRVLSILGLFCIALTAAGCGGHDAGTLGLPAAQTQSVRAAAPATSIAHAAGPYKIVYAFAGGKLGFEPSAAVLVSNGAIFGTTGAGGYHGGNCGGCGTVWSIKPTGKSFAVLYEFLGRSEGDAPYVQLARDAQGAFYGSSLGGNYPNYDGQVYELAGKTGGGLQHSTIRSFTGGKDGDDPSALLLDQNGTTMYGTTQGNGGGDCCGTAFQVDTDASGYKIVHYFAPRLNGQPGVDGGHPGGALVEDIATHTLYGIASFGGMITKMCESGCGTIYALVPGAGGTYKFKVLYHFKGGPDGWAPFDRLVLSPGKAGVAPTLYGTTARGGTKDGCFSDNGTLLGCGTVFALTPSGSTYKKTTLYTFLGYQAGDGEVPLAGLALVGSTLYGTTSAGGAGSSLGHFGSVFSVSTTGTQYKIVHSFLGGKDGSFPGTSLSYSNGFLYGVTPEGGGAKACTSGGAPVGCGTIYSIKP